VESLWAKEESPSGISSALKRVSELSYIPLVQDKESPGQSLEDPKFKSSLLVTLDLGII
jgi:hypothetical protein